MGKDEIGIRMALGARPKDTLVLIISQGMRWVLAGLLFGAATALAIRRLLAHQLFGITSTDPGTFVAVSALLVTVAVLACWLPARRATKVDPMESLRDE